VALGAAGTAGAVWLRRDSPGPVRQEVVVLPLWDTYVSEAKPEDSYGKALELRTDGAPTAIRSYLHFEVPTLPGRLTGARLRLYANAPDRTGVVVASVAPTQWTEGVTWQTAPALGNLVAQGRTVEADGWVELNVAVLVSQPGPLDLALVSAGDTMANYASLESGEDTAPRLVLLTES